MSAETIQYAFSAGEVSEQLYGRTDLEKYDLGLAKAENWFVDYRGGISTRPGTEFVDYVKHDSLDTKFVPFRFAPNLTNTYVLLFGHEYVRFIQDGAYILEAAKAITGITQASPGVVSSTAHGYATGDWLRLSGIGGMTALNGMMVEVGATTANTYALRDAFGAALSTAAMAAYTSGGSARRVYTVATPYQAGDLWQLRAYQIRDTLRLTHPDYQTRNLTRSAAISWALTTEESLNTMTAPTGLAGVASGAGTASVAFAVTAVSPEGEESQSSEALLLDSIVNYSTSAGSVTITWTPVAGARYYNVYRSSLLPGAGTGTAITRAAQLGFLGQSFGPTFTDANIIPDFTKSAPEQYAPFARGAVEEVRVTASGTGYDKNDTVALTGTGTGWAGFLIVNDAGEIVGVVTTKRGKNYTGTPTVVVTTAGGSGATFAVDLGATSGTDPRVSTIYQQRQVYAGTDEDPLTVWGSRPGRFSNFDRSRITNDADSYEHEVASEEVSPIQHLLPTRKGLLVFSRSGIWRLHGGTESAVTPLNAEAELATRNGSGDVPPLEIDSDILYIEGKGYVVRYLAYSELSKTFDGTNVSILSKHLFDRDKRVTQWGYASNPHYIVWAVRSDGRLLALTALKEQEVYAWTPHSTRGLFKDVVVVQEDELDRTYLMVQRYVGGRWTKFVERMAARNFKHVEEAWCVDCGLALAQTFPAATLVAEAATGDEVLFTSDPGVFGPSVVGHVIRAGGGKATILSYDTTTRVYVRIDREITEVVPEDDTPVEFASGAWTMDVPVSSVGGLGHLEGREVHILADGNVHPAQTVTNGAVALETPATMVMVGLPFTCTGKTLPPTSKEAVIENKRKRPIGLAVRLHESRGLKVGASLDRLRELRERTTEMYGEPTRLQSGYKPVLVDSGFVDEGCTFFVQEEPLPATVLGLVLDMEVGDDPR